MSTDPTARELALAFCDGVASGDPAKLASVLAPDATWWIIGRPEKFAPGGLYPARELLSKLISNAMTEWKFEVLNVAAEGDKVAIEAAARGKGPGTATYQNTYSFFFACRDGKIASIREYMDLLEVQSYIGELSS